MGDTEILHDNLGSARMRQTLLLILAFVVLLNRIGQAQTTITDRPLDVTVGNGLWGVFLPEYQIGSDQASNTALRDNGKSLGYQGDLRLIKRFLDTRTSVEARAFYGFAQSSDTHSFESLTLPDPHGNNDLEFGSGTANLQSNLDHYGYDLGLRDTWRTRFGGVSAGCLFSYMIFDQDFETSHQGTLALSEMLTSEFIGGKAVFGWDGYIAECPSLLDLSLGFYQLRTDYAGSSDRSEGINEDFRYAANPLNIEASFTTFRDVRNVRVATSFAVTHLGKIPYLIRANEQAASIEFDDGLMLRLMFEVLL